MGNVNFTNEDKCKFFDEISKHFYESNFGSLSKSEFELLMFSFYIEKMISDNVDEDGIVNYSACSDYRISQDLGITQQRVRNLKVKNQLVNHIEFDWKKSFSKLTANARYDKKTQKITINIPDPNLYLEIQNFIEEQGAYIEKQLNSKVMQLRVEYYIDLIVALEGDENREEIRKTLKQLFKEKGKDDDAFVEKEIGKSILNAAVNITDVIESISSIISPGNLVWTGFIKLMGK